MAFKKGTERTKVLNHLHIEFDFGPDFCTYRIELKLWKLTFLHVLCMQNFGSIDIIS